MRTGIGRKLLKELLKIMTRKIFYSFSFAGALLAVATIVGLASYAIVANANPSQFVQTTQTATATTSVAYMLPGTATTTLIFDTYNVNTGNNYTANKVNLLTQFTASSTLSQLNTNIEYSNGPVAGADCVATPTACDWAQDTGTNMKGFATTSLPYNENPVASYKWTFASSSQGQAAVSTSNNRDWRSLQIQVPTRYVRVVYTCAIGGAGCGVWGQIVPIKETK